MPEGKSRALRVNEEEAKTVRLIFKQYLALGSVRALEQWLKSEGLVSKRFTSAAGKTTGGVPFNRGALYHLLRNGIYLGMIRHKGVLHEGQHPPIIDRELFDEVQCTLDSKRRRHAELQAERETLRARAPLAGKIFDALGEPMSPATACGKFGKRYRYYVSAALQKGGVAKPKTEGEEPILRISADALESQLAALMTRLVPGYAKPPLSLPIRVEVHAQAIHLTLPKSACAGIQALLSPDERLGEDMVNPDALRLIASVRIRNRRGRTVVRAASIRASTKDPVLIGALQRAHAMIDLDSRYLPVCKKSPESQYGRRLIALALLAPDLQRAILDGTQPADLTLDHLMAKPLPCDWAAQRQLFDHV